ncbi:MAG TPA: alpha-1,4-glucan--maltose-1-phosphate maltosyltransferase [Thermoanaerobaculia bacterium]|nr:alpha-1,4-glucan--maltose-1-phosphate maltosyltransferase [Thermoanaerobaculia bacterium]
MAEVEEGRRRVVLEGMTPEIDCGRFPVKRTLGERLIVEIDAFTDGHDQLAVRLLWREEGDESWVETPMEPLGNDRWRGELVPTRLGRGLYTVEAWVDRFESWRRDFAKRVEAAQEVGVDLAIGAALVRQAAERAGRGDRRVLAALADDLDGDGDVVERIGLALDEELARLVAAHPDRRFASRYPKELALRVERDLARFSTWYEMFPRSASPEPGRHGTFADVEARLPYVAEMGFDVLYLPPIHPIGTTHRKGRNNAMTAAAGDVGSPWAIGGEAGGHQAIHPELGDLDDFRRLVARARDEHGIEVAIDIAFQASPDHPWVDEHPEWFAKRPDGTIQYAENPPKKYQDIYPFDFAGDDWRGLWEALAAVFEFWIEQGVTVFRVDNPHTKPFAFWEWAIAEIQGRHPEVIFLSEAFTRPRVMERLAKLGFTQSYTYFTWRTTKHDLAQYFSELTRGSLAEYLRPNLWPNTPDILTEQLQFGGRAMFAQRLVLAATLGASYGIYGPAFELAVGKAREPGSEEYLDSEKYQLRHWDLDDPTSLAELIARVNRVRRENPALQGLRGFDLVTVDNDQLLAYIRRTEDDSNLLLIVVNLDPHHVQSGWVDLPLAALGLPEGDPYQVHDQLTGAHYLWNGSRNFVELDPRSVPAHLFRLRRQVRSEQDFDAFG